MKNQSILDLARNTPHAIPSCTNDIHMRRTALRARVAALQSSEVAARPRLDLNSPDRSWRSVLLVAPLRDPRDVALLACARAGAGANRARRLSELTQTLQRVSGDARCGCGQSERKRVRGERGAHSCCSAVSWPNASGSDVSWLWSTCLHAGERRAGGGDACCGRVRMRFYDSSAPSRRACASSVLQTCRT